MELAFTDETGEWLYKEPNKSDLLVGMSERIKGDLAFFVREARTYTYPAKSILLKLSHTPDHSVTRCFHRKGKRKQKHWMCGEALM